MVDLVKVRRGVGTRYESDGLARLEDVAKVARELVEWVPDAALTLTAKHQGLTLVFTSACVVTIPTGLPEGFGCGFVQGGTGQVTLQPATGVTLNSQGAVRKSEGQWCVFGTTAIGPEFYLCYGGLVA